MPIACWAAKNGPIGHRYPLYWALWTSPRSAVLDQAAATKDRNEPGSTCRSIFVSAVAVPGACQKASANENAVSISTISRSRARAPSRRSVTAACRRVAASAITGAGSRSAAS